MKFVGDAYEHSNNLAKYIFDYCRVKNYSVRMVRTIAQSGYLHLIKKTVRLTKSHLASVLLYLPL